MKAKIDTFLRDVADKHHLFWFIDMKTSGGISTVGYPIQLTIEACDQQLRRIALFSQNFIPPCPPLPSALATYRISESYLESAEFNGISLEESDFESLRALFDRVLNKRDFAFCYNSEYIVNGMNAIKPMLIDKSEFKPCIEIMALAKKLIPIEDIGNYQMASVFTYLFKDPAKFYDLKSKSFNDPVDLTLNKILYAALCRKFSLNTEQAYDKLFERKLVTIMPFGKYKGMDLIDIRNRDKDYLSFLMSHSDFTDKYPDLAYSIKKIC